MALEPGSARERTGLAGAMVAEMEKQRGFSLSAGADGIDSLAKAIVEYIVANAEVDVSIAGVFAGADTVNGSGTIS
jgi:hypothetical protein